MSAKLTATARENRRLATVRLRFIYKGTHNGAKIYGEWINASDAFTVGYLVSNEGYIVIGIQLESEHGSRNGGPSPPD